MNYADIKECDISNGPGVRVSLFVSGCTRHCKNCFNKETWDFTYGSPFTQKEADHILALLAQEHIRGFSLLGGEPFEYSNQKALLPLLKEIKKRYPLKSVWCFTGYLFDKDILEDMCRKWKETKEMLRYLDILVDGKFIEEQKDLSLRFKGSANQRTILVQESIKDTPEGIALADHGIVLWDPESEP